MKYASHIIIFLLINGIATAQTPRINFKATEFYPEGTAYNAKSNEFFIGSVKTGTISTVNEAGKYKEFYRDSSLMSSFGMKVDGKNNLLWICTGDPNYSVYTSPATRKKVIRLVAVDLSTAKKKKDIDLSNLYAGDHFANDMTIDDAGNIYITDSYSPVIYKVDAKDNASVFVKNEFFKSLDIGLNGVVWFPKGYLLAVNNGTGSILKIDIKTMAVSKVKIDYFFPGADGLLRSENNELILVVNKGIDKIFKVTSVDDWKSAKISAATDANDRFQNPSTATAVNNKIYVVNSKLNEITDRSKKPSEEFSLQQVSFKPTK